jgi:phosphopantothenoylcysteine decarboxylase/phosphopantothenate--cysteine ligase
VGFAAETDKLIEHAKDKLVKKNLDLIVANYLEVSGKDSTEITIITPNNTKTIQAEKFDAAHSILDCILVI